MESSLFGLFGLSLAVCFGYLGLSDYRYRLHIISFTKSSLLRRYRQEIEKKNNDGLNDDGPVETKNYSKSDRNLSAEDILNELTNVAAGDDDKEVYTGDIRFLYLIIKELPEGEMPNPKKFCEYDCKQKNDDSGKYNHWFSGRYLSPGWCFRNIYLKHLDNIVVSIVSFVMLLGTIDSVHLDFFKENLLIPQMQLDLFILYWIGVSGVLIPVFLALIGRVYVCGSARREVLRCINNSLTQNIKNLYQSLEVRTNMAVQKKHDNQDNGVS